MLPIEADMESASTDINRLKNWNLSVKKVNLRFSKLSLLSVYLLTTTCYTDYTEKPKEEKQMANKSMGEIISTLRREKGMTQKELADMLNITDKAVSKWERDIACPDTMTIPKLAEILGVSVEELMNAKSAPATGHKGAGFLINIILKAVPLAMGVAVIVTSLLVELDMKSGFTMLGIGLACIGVYLLKQKE